MSAERGDVEPRLAVVPRADVRDAPVSEAQQVLGRGTRDGELVDAQCRKACARRAESHDGQVEREEPIDFVVGEREGQDDEPVDPAATEGHVEHAVALGRVLAHAVQRHVVAPRCQTARDAVEHVREEPAVEQRHDDADVRRMSGRESGCRGRDDVAEFGGGSAHADAGRIGDAPAPAERA